MEADCEGGAVVTSRPSPPQPLEERIAAACTRRLGVSVQFVRWQRDPRTGADTPVLAVPASHAAAAREAGLTIEVQPS